MFGKPGISGAAHPQGPLLCLIQNELPIRWPQETAGCFRGDLFEGQGLGPDPQRDRQAGKRFFQSQSRNVEEAVGDAGRTAGVAQSLEPPVGYEHQIGICWGIRVGCGFFRPCKQIPGKSLVTDTGLNPTEFAGEKPGFFVQDNGAPHWGH